MLWCDPGKRYHGKKHVIQMKIDQALEASNVSEPLYKMWKKEVKDYWTKVNWCGLPASQTRDYNGHVEARPLIAQIDITNQTTSHLVQKFDILQADMSNVRSHNQEMVEKVSDIKNHVEQRLDQIESKMEQRLDNIESKLDFLIRRVCCPHAENGQGVSDNDRVGLPDTAPALCVRATDSSHKNNTQFEGKSDSSNVVPFDNLYQRIIRTGVTALDKYMTIFKFDMFSLYQHHKTTKEWKDMDEVKRRRIVTNMGNAKQEVLKLISFSDETVEKIKALLFEKKTSPL